MKWIVLAVSLAAIVSVAASPFPQYDIDKACSEAAAGAVEDGMDSAEALAMMSLCKTLIGKAKDVAEPLWNITDEAKREECHAKARTEARGKGISEGWYPVLLECMRGAGGSKAGRLPKS